MSIHADLSFRYPSAVFNLLILFLVIFISLSITKINSKRLRLPPCFTPCLKWNSLDLFPFSWTSALIFLYKLLVIVISYVDTSILFFYLFCRKLTLDRWMYAIVLFKAQFCFLLSFLCRAYSLSIRNLSDPFSCILELLNYFSSRLV